MSLLELVCFRRPCAMLNCRSSLLNAMKCLKFGLQALTFLATLSITRFNCTNATMDLSLKTDLLESSSYSETS